MTGIVFDVPNQVGDVTFWPWTWWNAWRPGGTSSEETVMIGLLPDLFGANPLEGRCVAADR
ncbi:hypothetical protein JWS13_04770 (plasmid) [Rhodococcus pseudokoreensis]|uniref:Uncharacterized protein n=1 Tax=Rhodococcus pseudokoreensis TaxID=2811421 RepID=A0A974ZRS5_9NOCA|nr:hypothetical protein [Rhodococcus pseudokoreensis]QSE87985.1 hypothetical protein JWS13_04770 [Rhodococcus pseudokoreensis]